MFDAESFKNQEVTSDELSTSYIAIPEGDKRGVITKVNLREAEGKDGEKYRLCDVIWMIDDAEAKEVTGMDEPTCKQSLFLDINDAGYLDLRKGKNVNLNRLRVAVGQGDPSKPWKFSNLEGQVAIVSIKQTPSKDNPEDIYANVTKVAAA